MRVDRVIRLCGLEALRDRHPYDLSGGEMQRAALAKVLLAEPRLLLLDEPTKGLDAAFKMQLADILAKLRADGVAILMVTHDLDFCAAYADRVALVFDGAVASEGTPRAFFADKRFYTTAANRMALSRCPTSSRCSAAANRSRRQIRNRKNPRRRRACLHRRPRLPKLRRIAPRRTRLPRRRSFSC